MGRPRIHGSETREALLAAAGEIVAAEGTAGVTVRRVADEAGTTTRAVYSLFGDKAGLLRAMFQDIAETMRRHHEAVPVADDPTTEILPLALAYRAAALERPHVYELYLNGAGTSLALTDDDIQLAFASFVRVLDTLRRCVEQGAFPPAPPQSYGLPAFGLVHGLASLELRGFLGTPEEAEQHWRTGVTAVVEGFRAKPA